jgi:hypothetical protein
MRRSMLTLVTTVLVASVMGAQSPPNACGLLTKADVDRLIARGKPTYNAQPEAVVSGRGKGSTCLYPTGGQVAIYAGPNSAAAQEGTLKMLGIDKLPRQPVSGIGDKAFLIFTPKIKVDNDNQGPYLVMTVGEYTVSAFLIAWKGQADGVMSSYCRDSANVKKNDKKSCREIMADKSEVPESLQPAVEELGKILVAKVRAGKF